MQKISLFIILSITLTLPIAFAQEELGSSQKIALFSDNTAYQEGDVITITGTIEKVIPDMPVSLQLFFEKNLIQVAQVKVSQDGKFSDTFTAAGPQWQNEGKILIKANYGTDVSTELIITFFKNTEGEFASNYELKIPDAGTSDIQYTLKGGTVSSMKLDQENISLMISILTNTDGNLNISLPRDNIDSKTNDGQDIDYIVLIFQQDSSIPIQTNYTELETSDGFRAINIQIKNGDTKIEIVGTHVVPEFGAIAAVILAVAIISIIAVSAKSRLSFMPRI